MAQDFLDLTLPAHDPNFPKPRGLLAVPPEVAGWVAEFEARFAREHGAPMAPEAKQRILDEWTLNYFYDKAYIAYRRTPQGVEVLAVGHDESNSYREEHRPRPAATSGSEWCECPDSKFPWSPGS